MSNRHWAAAATLAILTVSALPTLVQASQTIVLCTGGPAGTHAFCETWEPFSWSANHPVIEWAAKTPFYGQVTVLYVQPAFGDTRTAAKTCTSYGVDSALTRCTTWSSGGPFLDGRLTWGQVFLSGDRPLAVAPDVPLVQGEAGLGLPAYVGSWEVTMTFP